MRIIFWNVRGLGKAYRRNWVRDHIMGEDLELVGIQETIKESFSDKELKEMAGNKNFSWFWVPARGHSGGLLSGIQNDGLSVEEEKMGTYFLAI